MTSIGTPLIWSIFFGLVFFMLALDLFIFGGNKRHQVSIKEALAWSITWVVITLLFALGLWLYLFTNLGLETANTSVMQFLAGYVLEKSLAVDNVFVWLMIFSYLAIPTDLQKRLLIYGVLGALVLRSLAIFTGSWIISEFDWVLYLFGGFLFFTGVKMWFTQDETTDLNSNKLLNWLKKHLRLSPQLEGERFFIRLKSDANKKALLYATPLFLALILVEISDLIFAVDSIPAIFAITTDPFIVLTSNIFAILGLRAMYFLIADLAARFTLLQKGLALVLVFIGIKMLIKDIYTLPISWSLLIILSLLVGSILLSFKQTTTKG